MSTNENDEGNSGTEVAAVDEEPDVIGARGQTGVRVCNTAIRGLNLTVAPTIGCDRHVPFMMRFAA
jgi:hypothetical protein